ncbi:MAG TPA: hypothetical protein VGS57_19880 [Thermoanaerobaculia bacterium]|jgi:hypothetical protein|nr:hypothetical protein [Thermoanaerobaculia bacterium]
MSRGTRVSALGIVLALVAPAAPAQVTDRTPKTAAELQRESGHVWDLAMPSRIDAVRPLKTKAFRRAIDDFRAGKGDVRHDVALSWGEFLSGTKKPFLALSLDRAVDADLAPGVQATLFGEIVDANGTAVASFEVPDQVELAAERAVVDAALPLPAGAARAIVGIALRGEVRWLLEQPLDVQPIDEQGFALSRPVLSLDVHPLPAPQKPDDPFCFGGLRVVPRGDRTFKKADAPWLFTVLRAPGAAPDAAPPLNARLVITGPEEGKTRRYPISGLTPAPLRGFDRQWGLGIPLPVGELPPGEYEATLEVSEKPAGANATAVTSFVIVGR